MTRLRPAYAMALVLSGAIAACSPPPMMDAGDTGGNDAADMSVQPDTPMPMGDGGGSDARPDGDGGANLCNMLPIEDLNALGMLMGDTVRYAGDNNMALDNMRAGIQVPNPTSTSSACQFLTTRQRVFKYTVRTNSVLRVSTTNPGTDPGFDTTLVAINVACPRSIPGTAYLGCNDDDPNFGADDRRISSSFVTVRQVMMGTNVYIGVGGFVGADGRRTDPRREHGNFVLTVQELPVIADGMPCDPRRLNNACGDASTCVANTAGGDTGTCRANGSVPGARCDMAGSCMGTGVMCDSTNNVCIRMVADGMPCDGFNQCGPNSTCTNQIRGAASGVCAANGSVIGTRCATGNMCTGTGLSCRDVNGTPTCLLTAAAGAACSTADSACPTGYSCVADAAGGLAGHCRATGSVLGAECDTPGNMCMAGAGTCNMVSATQNLCVNTAMTGAMCNNTTTCPAMNTCYLNNLYDRVDGRCYATGAFGGPCRMDGSCDSGSTCSDMMNPANGRCVHMAADGAACGDLTMPVACPMADACVRSATMPTGATCQALGSGAGVPCAPTGTACMGGTMCSATVIEEGVCQSTAAAGGSCAPLNASVRCSGTEVCRSTSLTAGTCTAPTMETEPNDSFMSAMTQPVTDASTPHVFRGALGRFDVDCYPVHIAAAGGRVFAQASSPSGQCPGINTDLTLDLYFNNAGSPQLLGVDNNSGPFTCPRIDGTDMGTNSAPGFYDYARNLAAGDYFVCVRNIAAAATRNAVPAYVVSISVP